MVYGAPDLRLGAVESYTSMLGSDRPRHPFHPDMCVLGGVRRKECSEILVQFFRERRMMSKGRRRNGVSGGAVTVTSADRNATDKSTGNEDDSRVDNRIQKKVLILEKKNRNTVGKRLLRGIRVKVLFIN